MRNDRKSAAFILIAAVVLAVLELMTDRPGNRPSDPVSAKSAGFAARWLDTTGLDGGYVPATRTEELRAFDLFTRLMAGDRGADLRADLMSAGFALETQQTGGVDWSLIAEHADAATGKGAYLVRDGGAPVLLQAPHRFKDIHTGMIAALLLDEHPILAAAWNTVPRWYDESGRRMDADLAHAAYSQFAAFGLAFVAAYPGGRVVQLHGFSHGKRLSDAGRRAGFIVSSGRKAPGRAAIDVATCLQAGFAEEPTLVFPLDVRELGGTTNTSGKALREAGFGGFVHLEISRSMRDLLLRDAGARARLAQCLTAEEGWW